MKTSMFAAAGLLAFSASANSPSNFSGTFELLHKNFGRHKTFERDLSSEPPVTQTSEEALAERVSKKFLSKLKNNIDPQLIMQGITFDSTIGKYKDVSTKYGTSMCSQIDLKKPTIGTCRPRLSSVIELANSIDCDSSHQGCSYTYQVSLAQTYSTTYGLMVYGIPQ